MFKQSEQNGFVMGAKRSAWRNDLLVACASFVLLGVATTARGQCLEGHPFASDGAADDYFGASIAISGDTAIVGAVEDDAPGGVNAGSAYIFVRSGSDWLLQTQLFASDGAAGDQFGYSVAIDGDTAVVGADWDDTAAGTNAGSAYIFVRSGGVWAQQAKLLASDAAAFDLLGVSVAISGDTAVVGAPGDNTPGGTDAGSVYVFVRTGTVWMQQAHLFSSDGAAGDFLSGFAVAIDGDTVVVAAYLDDTPAGLDAGSTYVFVRTGTVWIQQARLGASDGEAGDYFGGIVAVSGDTIIVGADSDDTPAGTDAGSAYVFVRSAGIWTEQAHLFASDGAAGDHFGWSVAISGDKAVVGTAFDDTPGGTDAGSAYTFNRSGFNWTEQAYLFASDGAADDQFGFFVAISSVTVVVAAVQDDTPGGTDAGSAYVFNLGCTPGDMNCDDAVNFADVNGFALALVDMAAYQATYPTCDAARADMNQDLLINGRDTQAFVVMLLAP